MLRGMRILVVEDEFVLAHELAAHFRDAGATILGPVPSIGQAACYLDSADGAILDIDLNGEVVFPLADKLVEMDIPFVFFSGHDEIVMPERFRYTQSLPKPAEYRAVANLFASRSDLETSDNSDVFRILPKLRLAARLQVGDAPAADRLVERTLKAALEEQGVPRHDRALGEWLNDLMESVLGAERADILN
jgi:hypothetical protein